MTQGDSAHAVWRLDEESIDATVTDPPYSSIAAARLKAVATTGADVRTDTGSLFAIE